MKWVYKIISLIVFVAFGICLGVLVHQATDIGANLEGPSTNAPIREEDYSIVLDAMDTSYVQKLVRAVDAATNRVVVVTDTLLLVPVLESFSRALERGVSLEIILQEGDSSKKLIRNWAPKNLPGAKFALVREIDVPTFMIIDTEIAIVTSLSLSNTDRIDRSVIAVATSEKSIVDTYQTIFVKLRSRSSL